MRLDTEFIRLPLRADAARLAAEVAAMPESAWRPHPQGFAGNSALPLISVGGDPADDAAAGAMAPTPHLSQMPYLQQVLAALGAVLGRTRLMRLDGNCEAQSHSDINYYWFDHARVHVPIATHADVTFHCGARSVHMAAGEVWIFDTWQAHRVVNARDTRRIHLVADTVGSAAFWTLVEQGDRVFASDRGEPRSPGMIAFDPNAAPALSFEAWNWPAVMPFAQLEAVVAQIRSALPRSEPSGAAVDRALTAFAREWRGCWALHGESSDAFAGLRERYARELDGLTAGLSLSTGADAQRTIRELLVRPALSPSRARPAAPVAAAAPAKVAPAVVSAKPAVAPAPAERAQTAFDRPVFIVCPPRSGSSLLFETLAQSPELWTIGGESHRVIESIPELHPRSHDFDSNRLTRADATPSVVAQLEAGLRAELRDRDRRAPAAGQLVRLLEKTPKNSLRVPFLKAAFPDAFFVYLYRDPRETLSSMLDAWRSGRFVTYPNLPGWQGPPWSLLLTDGWRSLAGRPLHEIVARQWAEATDQLLDDLEQLPPGDWCVASYDRLVSDARAEIERLCEFLQVRWDRPLDGPLPLSKTTLSSPEPEKWRKNAAEIEHMLPIVREVAGRARQLFGTPPAMRRAAVQLRQDGGAAASGGHVRSGAAAAQPAQVTPDFRSVYTHGFPQLLRKLGATLLVTTYQSGRVILVRADGDALNTHLRSFPSPMGIALGKGRLALGTEREIWEFFDMPALGDKLEPRGKHDAVYVPRNCAVTGDIRVHELAYAGDELWVTNTRFSALCTLDGAHSFVPRWRPPFVSALAPEDRCHLNGMCVVDDRVRYVTALGQSDAKGGWRANKAGGGVLLEVPSGRVVASGLCMPHSPRFYQNALWVLESGKGEIGRVDLERKSVVPRAQLDGFTRGLAFAGPYAFVGLSQVRESNVFGGIPLVDRVPQRQCGVSVVDLRDGKTVAFLRFEGTVQEIFDVQLLPNARFAELLEPNDAALASTYALPQEALAEVAQLRRG